MELGLPHLALAALRRRRQLVAQDARGCYLLGECLRELHRYRAAVGPLQRSLALIPDDVQVSLALSWCLKRTGRLAEAIEVLQRIVDVEPGEAIVHYNLACYWSLAGGRRAALQHLANALEIDGNFLDFVWEEPDFAPLRRDPLFQSLTGMRSV